MIFHPLPKLKFKPAANGRNLLPLSVCLINIKENQFVMLNEQPLEADLSNPLLNIFEDGIEEFVIYENHHPQQHKTRNQKNKQRIARLERDMNDAELKKKRNIERRNAEKAKMSQIISTMNEEQLKTFIEGRKRTRKQDKVKVRKAMETGQVIMVDLAYEYLMNGKENKSLGKQIELIMKGIKHVDEPPSIHLCSFQGGIIAQLEKMGYIYWPLTTHVQNIADTGKILNKKLVYLSPDAELPLEKVESDTAYILGGLIDRTIKKYASLTRARNFEIEARKLPIRQFMRSRAVLNLDHVVLMLCKFKECNDWKTAFDYGAPKRYKRDAYEGEEQKEEKEKEEESQDASEEEDQESDKRQNETANLKVEEKSQIQEKS